jgi:hypothetical protein
MQDQIDALAEAKRAAQEEVDSGYIPVGGCESSLEYMPQCGNTYMQVRMLRISCEPITAMASPSRRS